MNGFERMAIIGEVEMDVVTTHIMTGFPIPAL